MRTIDHAVKAALFVVEIKADQVEKQIKDYSDRLPK
jgi:hypothetical protein